MKTMEFKYMNTPVRAEVNLKRYDKIQEYKEKLKEKDKEIERLSGIIQQLTRDLDEAEEHAYVMQEKLSQYMERNKL